MLAEIIWLSSGVTQCDPDLPSWISNCVKVQFLYHTGKDTYGDRPYNHTHGSKTKIRYINPSIFEKEWTIL